MKEITRTIPVSTIKAAIVNYVDGKLVDKDLENVVVYGEEVKKENAMKAVAKQYGKENTYIVKVVTIDTPTYAISLEDFMKVAKKVEPKAQETTAPATPTTEQPTTESTPLKPEVAKL